MSGGTRATTRSSPSGETVAVISNVLKRAVVKPIRGTAGYPHSPPCQHLFHPQADVLCNFPEQGRRDITSLVKRNGCNSAISMAELLVRSALTYLLESDRSQNLYHFLRLENRYA